MESDILQEMRSDLRDSLKRGWVDAYHYLIPKSPENDAQEMLTVLKGWQEWANNGVVDDTMLNILLGYILAEHVLPCNINDFGADKLHDIYLKEAVAALNDVVTFEEGKLA